jgi:ferritin
MIVLQKLPPVVIDRITQRIADEQAAFYFYISASAWCRLNGYENASKYFTVESHGEEYHYKRLVSFLAEWNSQVLFPSVPDPIKTFRGLQDILEQAYNMEYANYKKYEANAIELFPVSQNSYMLFQDFVRTQNESVISAANVLKKLNNYLVTDPGLMLFDNDVFEEYRNYY